MKKSKTFIAILTFMLLSTMLSLQSFAGGLPIHSEINKALKSVVKEKNGGFGLNMWATVVDRDGVVKAVVFSGSDRGEQWPGSRIISAQKANTANAFSLPELALSPRSDPRGLLQTGNAPGSGRSEEVVVRVSAQGCRLDEEAELTVSKTEVVGVLLAGGLSRRMGGGDKGLMDLGGRTMLARVIDRLRLQVGQARPKRSLVLAQAAAGHVARNTH